MKFLFVIITFTVIINLSKESFLRNQQPNLNGFDHLGFDKRSVLDEEEIARHKRAANVPPKETLRDDPPKILFRVENYFACAFSKVVNQTLCVPLDKVYMYQNASFSCHDLDIPIYYQPGTDSKQLVEGFLPLKGPLIVNQKRSSDICHLVKRCKIFLKLFDVFFKLIYFYLKVITSPVLKLF